MQEKKRENGQREMFQDDLVYLQKVLINRVVVTDKTIMIGFHSYILCFTVNEMKLFHTIKFLNIVNWDGRKLCLSVRQAFY